MANLLRTPKSGNDWTKNHIDAHNISIIPQTKADFFETQDFPNPTEPSILGFMTHESREMAMAMATDKKTNQLLHYLDLEMNPKVGQETAVVNFAAELLRGLEYDASDDSDRIVFIRRTLPFIICGENSTAQIDICVMDDQDILLLVQDDKRLTSMNDPEPPLIAMAIAAFAMNNMKRERNLHLPPCDSIMLPALSMIGTTPVFYKITVTTALSEAVQRGMFPNVETRVLRYVPPLPGRSDEGMRFLPNRLEILRCLVAFKRFLGN